MQDSVLEMSLIVDLLKFIELHSQSLAPKLKFADNQKSFFWILLNNSEVSS
jgi:hypothetical protein